MSGAFGFTAMPATPAPDPRAVGQALAQQRFGSGAAPADRPAPAASHGAPPAPSVGDPLPAQLQLLGARHMSAPGQTGTGSAPAGMPDAPVDESIHHSAYHAGLGEAFTRMGGGLMPNPNRSPEQMSARRQQLLRLGLTPFEVSLLEKSGGA